MGHRDKSHYALLLFVFSQRHLRYLVLCSDIYVPIIFIIYFSIKRTPLKNLLQKILTSKFTKTQMDDEEDEDQELSCVFHLWEEGVLEN